LEEGGSFSQRRHEHNKLVSAAHYTYFLI
jgi:hypothetical protein